jgi:hypothetical protein
LGKGCAKQAGILALIVDARGENARLSLPYPDGLSDPEFTTSRQKI